MKSALIEPEMILMIEKALKAITNEDFLAAITTAILLIILGFTLQKLKLFNEHSKKTVTTILMKIALPCLAFVGFLIDFNTQTLQESMWIILFTILGYLLFLGVGRLLYIKKPHDTASLYSILLTFGQITLFGLPLVKAIYQENGILVGNMMSIPFRVFIYIYCFLTISGIKFEKGTISSTLKNVFCNPIIIAMLCSIFLWVLQPIMPKVTINEVKYSIFRFDKTIPWIYKTLNTIANLTMPLSMLLVGITLGQADIKSAFSNKTAWVISVFRSIISPLLLMGIIDVFVLLFKLSLTKEVIASIVICFAAPVSAVVNTFCIHYNREPTLSSNSCFLSTLLYIVFIPFIIVLVELIF